MPPRLPKGAGVVAIGLPLLLFLLLAALATSPAMFWTLFPHEGRAAPAQATQPARYSSSEGIRLIAQSEPNDTSNDPYRREPWLGDAAWIAAIQAGQEYIAQHPEPQNVQVLKGMTTGEVWAYMIHMSGALGVSCQYCHDIRNYAADAYPQKISGRLMIRLVQDLNTQYLSQIPTWAGNYVQCATCHQGQPKGMLAFSARNSYMPASPNANNANALQTFVIDTYAIAPSAEFVTAHPTTGKMLSMTNFMRENWAKYVLPNPEYQELLGQLPVNNRQDFIVIDETVYSAPNCYTCHMGNRIPTGAISRYDLKRMEDGGWTLLPDMLRSGEVDPTTGRAISQK